MQKEKKTRRDKIELSLLAFAGAAIVVWAGWSVGSKVKRSISAKTYYVGTGAINNYLNDVVREAVQTEFITESAADESEANAEEEKEEKENQKENQKEKEETEDAR